jgi:hypothetical protein
MFWISFWLVTELMNLKSFRFTFMELIKVSLRTAECVGRVRSVEFRSWFVYCKITPIASLSAVVDLWNILSGPSFHVASCRSTLYMKNISMVYLHIGGSKVGGGVRRFRQKSLPKMGKKWILRVEAPSK